ncbi:MAG: MaoC family dehydratase [Chloroflexota bacterium]
MNILVGQVETLKRVFSQEDFNRFAVLSGDDNPIHVDPAFSARTTFGKTVAHGMLLYGVVCTVLGTRLPGPGTVQLEQELMFPTPTYVDEEVTVQVEVTAVQPEKALAELATVITRPGGEVGLQGRTLVCWPGGRPASNFGAGLPPLGSTEHVTETLYKNLRVGQRDWSSRVFTAAELAEYADLTGDTNPVFTDTAYAIDIGFNGPAVPGSLIGGMFSYLLGTQLPGRGTNYLKQRLVFLAPIYPGEKIKAEVEIIRLRPEKELVNLRTLCTTPTGKVVCAGEALVLVRDLQVASR